MSSLLYLLSYSLYADNGFAPISPGHEPSMLLLHQSTFITLKYNGPVRDLHSYLPITKRVHYYYANQAKKVYNFDKYVI